MIAARYHHAAPPAPSPGLTRGRNRSSMEPEQQVYAHAEWQGGEALGTKDGRAGGRGSLESIRCFLVGAHGGQMRQRSVPGHRSRRLCPQLRAADEGRGRPGERKGMNGMRSSTWSFVHLEGELTMTGSQHSFQRFHQGGTT